MKSSRCEQVNLYASAAISIVGLASLVYGSVEFYNGYFSALGPPRDQDFWEGGDVVLAIKQRGMTAATYIRGFQFALAVTFVGAGVQGALVYRQTRDIPAALRALFQVELIYQAVRNQLTRNSECDFEAKSNREAAAAVVKIGNYGVYCTWALNSINNTYISVFERPIRSTINGRDLVSVWTVLAMIMIVLGGVLAANHLANAVWSVWHARTEASTAKEQHALDSSENSQPAANRITAGATSAAEMQGQSSSKPSIQCMIKAVLGYLVCIFSILSHLTILSLISLYIGGLIVAVAVGQFVALSLAYYAATRKLSDSMFWSFLSEGFYLAFDYKTHRRAWWVSVIWAITFASMGIVFGVLQATNLLFTRWYHDAANTLVPGVHGNAVVTNFDNESLAVERNFGIFVVCMAAADLVVYLIVVFSHMQHKQCNAQTPEAEVHMSSMA